MLVPAFNYIEELSFYFNEELYSNKYFYYCGYPHAITLPNFEAIDNHYKYAILDKDTNIIGYFCYSVDPYLKSVDRIGMYSFGDDISNGLQVLQDCFNKLNELAIKYHRIEWRGIGGNPANNLYRQIIGKYRKKYGFHADIHTLTDAVMDKNNQYADSYIYEIINEGVE